MKIFKGPAFVAGIILLGCSCATSDLPRETKASIASIKRYVNSFAGLNSAEVRNRLAGVKLVEESWSEEGISGKQLVATFPDYELRIFFFRDRVVTSGVHVISK